MAGPPWRVECVSHLARVNAYYTGGGIRVRQESLQPPLKPFYNVPTADEEASAGDSNRARKKRKKLKHQQLQLQQLIADGKFVPLEAVAVEQLASAHAEAALLDQWKLEINSGAEATGDVIATAAAAITSDSHCNSTDRLAYIHHSAVQCVMPARSHFVKGDVRAVLGSAAATALGHFQLIVMDPPWENKSVDRKRCYATFHHRELLKIDVPSLSVLPSEESDCAGEEGTVLAIWVTNRPMYMAFILEELLPAWGFTYHATWYWLKVCMDGNPVSPLSSTHRLPVEKLVVATRAHSSEAHERLGVRLGHTPKIVVSVPLRHSWKPPPECFFPSGSFTGRKLEVFARELRPHYVSVGNEPLKFQATRLFEPIAASTPPVQSTQNTVQCAPFSDPPLQLWHSQL